MLLPPLLQNLIRSQIGEPTIQGAAAFGFQHPVVIVASTGFVILAGTAPAGDRDAGLLELVLARPLARARYLLAILATAVLPAVLLPLCLLFGALVGLELVGASGDVSWTWYLPDALGLVLLLLAVAGLSLWAAAAAQRRGVAVSRLVGLLLVTYLIEIFGMLWSPLGHVSWISPFHYFVSVSRTLHLGQFPLDVLILVSLFGLSTALAFRVFTKRDI